MPFAVWIQETILFIGNKKDAREKEVKTPSVYSWKPILIDIPILIKYPEGLS